jgi:hypothetical protein
MVKPRQVMRGILFGLLLPVFLAAFGSLASAQSFTITTTAPYPSSVDPGESATATINLGASGGFDDPVLLDCAVTSGPTTTSEPACIVSPSSQVPPAKPALTITTTNGTTAGTYQFTVTGTSGSIVQSATLYVGVADITENYALSVLPNGTATPGSVAPGETATATVSVSPLGTYSGHQVTLSCLSVTPIVTAAPTCSFNPATVTVGTSGVATSVLTITSYGPSATTTTRVWRPRIFYAALLLVPGLALAGIGSRAGRRSNALGMLLLIVVAAGLLLMPGCGTSNLTSTTTTTLNGSETPKNNYIFTLTGVDENGAAPSTTGAPTVTLAVN